MHKSALDKAEAFVKGYLSNYVGQHLDILDVGSQAVEGQASPHKKIFSNPKWDYQGMDIEAGNNVDIVVKDPYSWDEIQDQSFDVVVCSQVFEHVEYPWVSMMEIVRVLKNGGVALIISPSQGEEHKYPYDCYRYYSDGMTALSKYVSCNVVEVYTQWRDIYLKGAQWHDTALVVQKPFWGEQELQSFMLKNKLNKIALGKSISVSDMEGINDTNFRVINSELKAMTCLDVFYNLEETVISETGLFKIKIKKAIRKMREAITLIVKPL